MTDSVNRTSMPSVGRLLRTETNELTKKTEDYQPSLTSGDARAHVQEIR